MNNSIINCEIDFKKCFSKWTETDQFIRFRDSELPDMYDHNMTLIKTGGMDIEKIRSSILAEVNKSIEDGFTFSKSMCDKFIEKSALDALPNTPDITHYGFYLLDCNRIKNWKKNEKCRTQIADSQKSIDDLLTLELANYGVERGEDFCTRRVNRIGKVFLSQVKIDLCLIYRGEELAGKCDLFVKNNTAKIEDLDIKINLRKMYIGTTLLKSVIENALKHNAHEIYLVTDEEDTVKDMYQNLGFKKVCIWTEIFWDAL